MDLPGQAMEAEEIIKQLDMEQVEEMPMGTAISAQGQCALPYPIAMPPYHIHTERVGGDEEEEVVTHVDLPPLTGTELKHLKEQWAFVCLSGHHFVCLSALRFICLSVCTFIRTCLRLVCHY